MTTGHDSRKMNSSHPEWNFFLDRLNVRVNRYTYHHRCSNNNFNYCRRLMELLGLDDIAITESINSFRTEGLNCDCNVVKRYYRRQV